MGSDDANRGGPGGADYPEFVRLNTRRVVLDGAGREVLEQVARGYRDALGTIATVYEANGDYATDVRPAGWCALMDSMTRPADRDEPLESVRSGRWRCRHSCRSVAQKAIETGQEQLLPCPGGLRVSAVPIRVAGEVVGALTVGLGAPPRDDAALEELAKSLCTTRETLAQVSASLPDVPDATIDPVVRTMRSSANLISELLERARTATRSVRGGELLLGTAAHDLRSPLTALTLGCHELARDLEPERRQRLLARMERSLDTARQLVNDLLDLSRVRLGGGIPLVPARTDVATLARQVAEELSLAEPDARIDLAATGDTHAMVDPERVREVVTNLVRNAIRHAARAPVAVEGQEEALAIAVHNGGPAIPEALRATLFDAPDPEKMQARAQAGRRGLGLGLHIAQEIAQAHGGSVEVRSTDADGTTFVVRLPRDG